MDHKQWMKRISHRSDFTCGLVHLTKPMNKVKSLDVLINILKERTLKASITGYICGKDPVVCFQDVHFNPCLRIYFMSNDYVKTINCRTYIKLEEDQ